MLQGLILFQVLLLVQSAGPGQASATLKVTIVDHATKRPVPARCYLTDANGRSWTPEGAIQYVKPPEHNFIAAGGFTIALPVSTYTLVVERGPEYRPVSREIRMAPGEPREETIDLRRWIGMNARGWYSGDLHNHRPWKEIPQLLLANDLNLAPTLTY